jgi:hypothetical protein
MNGNPAAQVSALRVTSKGILEVIFDAHWTGSVDGALKDIGHLVNVLGVQPLLPTRSSITSREGMPPWLAVQVVKLKAVHNTKKARGALLREATELLKPHYLYHTDLISNRHCKEPTATFNCMIVVPAPYDLTEINELIRTRPRHIGLAASASEPEVFALKLAGGGLEVGVIGLKPASATKEAVGAYLHQLCASLKIFPWGGISEDLLMNRHY